MKTRFISKITLCLLSLAALLSCEKGEPTSAPPATDLRTVQAALTEAAPPIQSFGMDAGMSFQFVGQNGTRIQIPANAFVNANGSPVQGPVTLKLQEIFDFSGMLTTNRPTVSNEERLVSGGQLFFDAQQGGQSLAIAPNTQINFQVPAENPDPNMAFFQGGTDADGNFTWEQGPISLQTCFDSITGSSFYCFGLTSMVNWINCDYFARNYQGPLTSVTIAVPQGFTNKNTTVWVYFPGINSATRVFEYNNQIFSISGTLQVPIGYDAIFVAIRENGSQFDYAYSNTQIANQHHEILNFQTISKADLLRFLQSL